jgi:hypothetical protein
MSSPLRQNAGCFQLIKLGFPCQEENRNRVAKFLNLFFGIPHGGLRDRHSLGVWPLPWEPNFGYALLLDIHCLLFLYSYLGHFSGEIAREFFSV